MEYFSETQIVGISNAGPRVCENGFRSVGGVTLHRKYTKTWIVSLVVVKGSEGCYECWWYIDA